MIGTSEAAALTALQLAGSMMQVRPCRSLAQRKQMPISTSHAKTSAGVGRSGRCWRGVDGHSGAASAQ
jgi:hypothetical protein